MNFNTRFFTKLLVVAAACIMYACGSDASKTKEPIATDTTAMKKDSTPVFDHLLVDNKKDPSCGMPVSAGIGDTAHYKDKVLGFCSKECKEEFLKNPQAHLAAAEITVKK